MNSELSAPDANQEYALSLERRIVQLEGQVAQMEKQMQAQTSSLQAIRESLPNSGILSQKFLTRAFTVYGHMLVAGLLIAIPIYCLFSLLVGLSSLGNY